MRISHNIAKFIVELGLRSVGTIMRGSVTIMRDKNKQPYFSVSKKGKTKVIYLEGKRARVAEKYAKNYRRVLEIIDGMTEINMELLKRMKTK